MVATNKAFADVFNTISENQKCNWAIFSPVSAPKTYKKLNARVGEVLTSSVIQDFHEVLDRYLMCPYAFRIPEFLMSLGLSKAQVLAWSSELHDKVTQRDLEVAQGNGEGLTRE
ncbi:unnamed protein product [Phytophthora fragariaefolia]|uniref:Unnamed protein product n=1 Tax=Phytophthora fragariaefolia TaxID=1490495 RepID=A0A9W6U655_9STRA|nr:unnamed protein product [Phytophthora fragariaefolia]